ncbi:MAG: ABC transporter ATP-binding protein [Gemmataceae bacterium]
MPIATATLPEPVLTPPPPRPAARTTEPVLQLNQVSKWYGPVLALNQVTLELRGGITGLVGANGAGKSTLIRLATGQARPTLGTVRIRGVDAWDWRARRLVGYCPDLDAFYEDQTGRDFLRTMARLCGYPRTEADDRAEATLRRVGMVERAHRKLRGYSKGMRQRIKLAQALLTDPEFIVLDEPLSGIDPVGRQEMLQLFQELAAAGKCLLISSHELEELEKLTNHVAIMARGRVAAVGTLVAIREMLADFPLSVRIEADRPRELAADLLQLDGVTGVDIADGHVTVRACNPRGFYPAFTQLVLHRLYDIRQMEPLDDSTHAILGYLLGGSGKT